VLTVALINTVAAAALIIGAIIGLYFVRAPGKRLGLVTMLTGCFALCVWLLTNARRAEIFVATATYAAVLVVFVSGNLGQ
jgi:Na+/phosphate symporter